MNKDRMMRLALQLTTPFTLIAAFSFAFPTSWTGQLFGLPVDVPGVYRAFVGGAVGLFGFTYAWLSAQQVIDRPLVIVATCAKLFAFAALFVSALVGELPIRSAVLGCGDLFFAIIFLRWWLGAEQVVRSDAGRVA